MALGVKWLLAGNPPPCAPSAFINKWPRRAPEEAAASAVGEGQTAYNKRRQVLALDWLLLNAPEDAIPMDYRNDAIKARS